MKFSIKTIVFTSFVSLLIILASGTVIEKVYGTAYVQEYVYGAWWFVVLWAILGISSLIYIFQQKLYQKKAVFVLHCAFVFILSGAFITFISGEKGYLHIRQGEISNVYISEDGVTEKQLPFDVKLLLFDIAYHPDEENPADFISFLKIDDEVCQVSMNKIHKHQHYRFYQQDYDTDEMGTTLLLSRDPWGIGITYTGYLLLGISILWLLWLRIGWKGCLSTFIPLVLVWFYISKLNPMTPILRTPLLAIHVSLIMVAYGIILWITINSVIALFLSEKRERMYRRNYTLLYPAVFLLAAGIFVGAVWANISWGRYWGWDAKETWALITLLVYALPFHRKSLSAFHTQLKFHRYCVIAFFTVLMTFLGVSFLLGGIHSYV